MGRYAWLMAIRPTVLWREGLEEEARQVASGELRADWADKAEMFPETMLSRTDEALEAFERDIACLDVQSDDTVLAAVKRLILKLTTTNRDHDDDTYATGERDQLCTYIDEVLAEAGVDLDGLAARHGIPRRDIADEWRTW
ncbi:hypothetical protein EDD27_3591 [Nonomuraea polychroma]|uniref:Uncharacterized protein n=1 Tax=Nonomuraea polychroma TaxID=46176 RepID=A0A438M5U0_9ACTN|nr:hypothetical protein EDD27_3591 [Nonomuraea polychroma]